MLPFEFEYYKPPTLKAALKLFHSLRTNGGKPMYILGGTELITLGRLDLVFTDSVIDIKEISEMKIMDFNGDYLVLGGALSLTEIEQGNLFPLLTKVSREIADHTAREKITLGGNICGQIFYREAVLPFLLADSQLVLAGQRGINVVPINEKFQEQLHLESGEFLVQIATEKRFISAPYFTFKHRQQWKTGYPLITAAAIKIDGNIRAAFSGLCPFPFRSKQLEDVINNPDLQPDEKVNQALNVLPTPILNDVEGSDQYRLFVLSHLLKDVLTYLDQV